MKATMNWTSGMKFSGLTDGQAVLMDAKSPIGSSSAPTPKELVILGLGGCTAMDVVALLKKHKQTLNSLQVDVDVEKTTSGHPMTFTHALITFTVTGTVDAHILNESVLLSQTKYCGVSAMLSKAFPIEYRVLLNGEEIGRGKAHFESNN